MAKKTRKKRTTRVKRAARSGTGLATISLSDLRAELQRRQRAAMPLLRRRERLVEQLTDIDGQLAAHGINVDDAPAATPPTPPTRGVGRPRRSGTTPKARKVSRKAGGRSGPRGDNSMKLVDALHSLLSGTQMAVKDVVVAVQKSGYKTKSPNFRTIVNQALTANPDRFKKVSRGVYTSK